MLPLALRGELPGALISLAALVVFGGFVAVHGASDLARAAAAGTAIAAALLVAVRSAEDLQVAVEAFALAAGIAALVAAVSGMRGTHADVLAGAAAIGLGLALRNGSWAAVAADLGGVVALHSRAGFVAVACAAFVAPFFRTRALVCAAALAAAWLAGAPPAHAPWVHGDYGDVYHRLGVPGAVLFALLLAALLRDLPLAFAPAVVAAGAAAILAPVETAAPVLALAGFAGGRAAYDRAVASERERRLDEVEARLVAEARALDAQRVQLARRVDALDERERSIDAEVAARTPVPAAPRPAPAARAAAAPGPARFRPVSRRFTIAQLEDLVATRGAAFPERQGEWRTYLDALRAESAGGVLPERFEPLVREVFAPLLDAPSG